jgi:hypothetical protein
LKTQSYYFKTEKRSDKKGGKTPNLKIKKILEKNAINLILTTGERRVRSNL